MGDEPILFVKVPKDENLNLNSLHFYMRYDNSSLDNTTYYNFGKKIYDNGRNHRNHWVELIFSDGYFSDGFSDIHFFSDEYADEYYFNEYFIYRFEFHFSFQNYDIYSFKFGEEYSLIDLYINNEPRDFNSSLPNIKFYLNENSLKNYFLIEVPTDFSQKVQSIKCLDKNDILVTKYKEAEEIKAQKKEEEKISEQEIKKAKAEKILFFILGIISLALLVAFCTLFGFALIAAKIAIALIVSTAIASAVFSPFSVFFYNKVKAIHKDFEEKIQKLNDSLADIQKNENNIFDTNTSPNNNSQTQSYSSVYAAYMQQNLNNDPAHASVLNPYSLPPDNSYPPSF